MLIQIDILINNGGRTQRSLCLETSLDVYQALMELNFLGTASLTKQVLPHMTQRGTGSVVTVSSVAGLAGAPLATGYCASKHALQVKFCFFYIRPVTMTQLFCLLSVSFNLLNLRINVCKVVISFVHY